MHTLGVISYINLSRKTNTCCPTKRCDWPSLVFFSPALNEALTVAKTAAHKIQMRLSLIQMLHLINHEMLLNLLECFIRFSLNWFKTYLADRGKTNLHDILEMQALLIILTRANDFFIAVCLYF